jgi:hypothetical protein
MHKQLDSNDRCKVKPYTGVVCTGACLCLGTKLVFLSFTNVDRKALILAHLARCRNQT